MKGFFIGKKGIAFSETTGENKEIGITARKLTVKMTFEDLEFDDLCDVVQSIYGTASVGNIETHIRKSLLISDTKIVK
ncbi:MAG: hypothetical protein L6Q54_06400 [Leptospiraceae bacterium]|nr:hypothetical protein [Leptospiraceae bacterium]MCK6380867.1 hypothetical protein [Leptospiraceae bacterium]